MVIRIYWANKKRMATSLWVVWVGLCIPKFIGGLRFQKFVDFNQVQQIITQRHLFASWVLLSKYLANTIPYEMFGIIVDQVLFGKVFWEGVTCTCYEVVDWGWLFDEYLWRSLVGSKYWGFFGYTQFKGDHCFKIDL